MYDSINVTRTLISVPSGDAYAVNRALIFGDALDTGQLQPSTRHLAELCARQASGGRFVPLSHAHEDGVNPGWALQITCGTSAESSGKTVAVEWWSFDFGDVVHAHAVLYAEKTRRRYLPISRHCAPDTVATTSRPYNLEESTPATNTERIRNARLYRTDYMFGDTCAPLPDLIGIPASTHANGAFAGTHVEVVSGPEIDSPAWRTPPAPLGTDIVADADNPTGVLRAEYRMTRNI